MKKKLILFASMYYACFSAQQNKVGINTDNPSATLDIVSKANTSATKALKISNSSNTEMVTVRDNGQVGINQATPETDALLELKSTNKSLLLTRVTNATDVATPVNGMMVYDITQKCVRAYENAAWSGCLSAGGSTVTNPPTYGSERTPCSGLADVRDFSFSNNALKSYAYPMFISGDGYIYGGWMQDLYGMTGLGNTYTGDVSTTYNYSTNDLHSAYPAANILKNLPNAKWKRIMGSTGLGNYMYGITEDGKMYVWGTNNYTSGNFPLSGTLATFTNRTQAETPREIVNPDGNQWKEFYTTSEYIFAVDHTGKWWSWGGRTSQVYNAISFAYSPVATASYYLTPRAAAALVPAPKYDPNMEETFAAFQGNSAVSFVYIGTDNKLYPYGENVGVYGGAFVNTPQQITMPTGVTPIKVMAIFQMANFLILGDNGIIYRVGNGTATIPATGFTAVAFTTNTYNFKDFIIANNNTSILGVPKNGGDMVKLTYSYTASGFTTPTATTLLGTGRLNPVKLWNDTSENLLIKDGNSGNTYIYRWSPLTGTSWPTKAIGFNMSGTTDTNYDPNNTALNALGPFKLINCQN